MKSERTMRLEAECKALPDEDFWLVHQSLSRREIARRLAAGDDPAGLIVAAGRAGYLFGYTEGYRTAESDASMERAFTAIEQSRARREDSQFRAGQTPVSIVTERPKRWWQR